MSVVDGQPVNAAVTNAGFVDKNTATTFTNAILALNNSDPASGAFVDNVQRELNKILINIQTTQTISDASPIVLSEQKGNQLIPVAGSGGPISLSSTPFISINSFFDGMIVKLIGTDDTNTVTMFYTDSVDGGIINGTAVLERFGSLTLVYSSEFSRWIELSRTFKWPLV